MDFYEFNLFFFNLRPSLSVMQEPIWTFLDTARIDLPRHDLCKSL